MLDSTLPRLGFLGTGNIASAVVEGFSTCARPPAITVSPRNEAKSRGLAERWPNVHRAGSNQEVLDGTDLVFIALRPALAPEVLPGLHFRPDQTIVSLIPLVTRAGMQALVQPASRVFKALPLPYVARHLGQIPYFPPDAETASLLANLCEPLPVQSERELHRLWAITGLISLFYALLEATRAWSVGHGAGEDVSKRYTASMFASLARLAEEGEPFDILAAEAATPGGLNEMALRMMKEGSMFTDHAAALDAILARFGPDPAP